MKSTYLTLIAYFVKYPKRLFLVDGVGAAFTSCALYFLLRPFPNLFGLPSLIIKYLAGLGLVYLAYGLVCFLVVRKNWSSYITVLGMANVLYCFLTISLIGIHHNTITLLGVAYLTSELLVILVLANLEFQTAKKLK